MALGAAIALGATASAPSGSAEAATPTTPPPVTILTSQPHTGRGDIFISPFSDASTYVLDGSGRLLEYESLLERD